MGAVGKLSRVNRGNLKEQLFQEVYNFDFHQVVRLMEMFTPSCIPLGEGVDPNKEALRISSRISFSFATGDLNKLYPSNTADPFKMLPQLSINFMGLAGVSKPIPTPYAYRFYQRTRWRDTATKDFLDIFNHRFAGLLYRIHKKFRVELSNTYLEDTSLGNVLSSVAGVYQKSASLKNRINIPDRALIGYASYFWKRPPSAYALEKIIGQYFSMPVSGKEFYGAWIKAAASDWSRLSSIKNTFNVLGSTMILGTKAWDQQAGTILELGPISYEKFLTFLPMGSKYDAFCDLARLYTGDLSILKMNFIIQKETIPKVKLGSNGYLGYTTWMHAAAFKKDDQQVTVDCKVLD